MKTISRREVLGGALATLTTRGAGAQSSATEGTVMTVTGAIPISEVGVMLPHEHLLSMFGGDPVEHAQYDESRISSQVVPYGRQLKSLGCDSIADCTTARFGRRPDLLAKLSHATGLKILTNSGYYGAANGRYVPEHARSETADQLATRWIAEWKNGIGDSDIRPGFLKIAVQPGVLSALDAKLVRAAAITHKETGLTMAIHTGHSTESVRGQRDILREEGVALSAWIWVHANKVEDPSELIRVANDGGWIELDGVSTNPDLRTRHLSLLAALRKAGRLDRVLLSHDGSSLPYGGKPMRPFDALFTDFLPAMRKDRYDDEEIRQVTVENPGNAFQVARRLSR